MYYYKVFIAHKFCDKYYTYKNEKLIVKGQVIKVCFGRKIFFAIVKSLLNQEEIDKINFETKEIIKITDIIIKDNILKYIALFAEYNFLTIGATIELFLPNYIEKKYYNLILNIEDKPVHLFEMNFKETSKIKKLKKFNLEYIENKTTVFTSEQNEVINKMKNNKDIFFLSGETGSGKTVVSIEFAAQVLKEKKGKILIITPEIILNTQWASLLEKRTGMPIFIYNNKLSPIYKNSVYRWSLSDEPGIIVGARSAMFLPFNNLSLVIIDEEHSSSLKQINHPVYHAKEMLILKTKLEKIPLLLISATPTVETFYKILNSDYKEYNLPSRTEKTKSQLFFVKKHKDIFSFKTIEMIKNALTNNNQVLIFLNRKGFAPYCICSKCKELLKCLKCDQAKVFYQNYKVVCHKCYEIQFLQKFCNNCKSDTTWNFFGIGIEKVEKFIKTAFPQYITKTITSDTENIDQAVSEINNKECNIILSTQILTQGHDFKFIELVVIVDGDIGLTSINFRINEQIYQLWQQIRGRSGRHEVQGKMIIQYNDDSNKFIELIKNKNPYEVLLKERKELMWPPFSKVASITFESKNKEELEKLVNQELFKNYQFTTYGPLYIGMMNKTHKFQYLIKFPANMNLFKIFNKNEFEKGIKLKSCISVVYDIDFI